MSSTWPQHQEMSRTPPRKKLRYACDSCHHAKTKCSGGTPCSGCLRTQEQCIYSQSNRVGRPKGTKNKRTRDLIDGQHQASKNDGYSNSNSPKFQDRNTSVTDSAVTSSASKVFSPNGQQQQHHLSPQHQAATALDMDIDSSFQANVNFFLDPAGSDHDFSFGFPDSCESSSASDFGLEGNLNGFGISLPPQLSRPAPNRTDTGFSTPAQGKLSPAFRDNDKNRAFSSENLVHMATPPTSNPFPDETNSRSDFQSSSLSSSSSSSSSSSASPSSSTTSAFPNKNRSSTGRNSYNLTLPQTTPVYPAFSPSIPNSIVNFNPPDSPVKCNCLQHHAKLLIRLKDIPKGPHAAPIDVILNGVQQALGPLKHYIQCRACQGDEDKEVLLLSVMSIRIVLCLLKGICTENNSSSSSSCFDKTGMGTAMGMDIWKSDALPPTKQQPVISTPGGTRLSVGSYEITGEERMLVLEVLISKTLGKIQFVLAGLRERSSRQRRGSSTPPLMTSTSTSTSGGEQLNGSVGENHGDHVEQLLRGLESKVQALLRTVSNQQLPVLPVLPVLDGFGDLITMPDIMT